MKIGPHLLANKLFVAPMAGVTDRPFRQLCKKLGAGYAVSEMIASKPYFGRVKKLNVGPIIRVNLNPSQSKLRVLTPL
jgi:tRNA-dihydrouridine synthase